MKRLRNVINKQIFNYIKSDNQRILKQYSKYITNNDKLVFNVEEQNNIVNYFNNNKDIQNKTYSTIYSKMGLPTTNRVTFKNLTTSYVKNISKKFKSLINKHNKNETT